MIHKFRFFLLIFLIGSFTFCSKKYKVVSISMEKTYSVGETIAIKKKFGKPKRYDIVSFKNPSLENTLDLSRVLGLPGETLQLKNGHLHINGRFLKDPSKLQLSYLVTTDGSPLYDADLQKLRITRWKQLEVDKYEMFLTINEISSLQQIENITNIEQILNSDSKHYPEIFPNNNSYNWNRDNFGELKIPKKGEKITITFNNIFVYLKILNEYEKASYFTAQEFIDNVFLKKDYVFKYDYYILMSDNRAISLDSRHWGFIPEQFILGKVKTSF